MRCLVDLYTWVKNYFNLLSTYHGTNPWYKCIKQNTLRKLINILQIFFAKLLFWAYCYIICSIKPGIPHIHKDLALLRWLVWRLGFHYHHSPNHYFPHCHFVGSAADSSEEFQTPLSAKFTWNQLEIRDVFINENSPSMFSYFNNYFQLLPLHTNEITAGYPKPSWLLLEEGGA